MRSTAERRKDGPLVHTAAAALVVGQCCVITLQLLPVPASLWMRLRQRHTARRRAQPRLGQQVVSAQPFSNSRGFTKVFSNMVFYNVDYYFLTQNFFLPCVVPFVLTVQEAASTRNKEGTHNFLKVLSINSGALAVPRSAAEKFWRRHCIYEKYMQAVIQKLLLVIRYEPERLYAIHAMFSALTTSNTVVITDWQHDRHTGIQYEILAIVYTS